MKVIKSHIIEVKDTPDVIKQKFLTDPNIYVNNEVSCEIREFLCKLLNTFYKVYEENQRCERESGVVAQTIADTITEVAETEEMLFRFQKDNITEQVQLEGENLKNKSILREESQRLKEA